MFMSTGRMGVNFVKTPRVPRYFLHSLVIISDNFVLFHSTLDQSKLVDGFVMRNEQGQARFALGVTRH